MANKKYDHIDTDYIVDQYTIHMRTSVELAEELGVSDWWIRDRLKSKNIPIRRAGGGLTTIDLTGQRFGNYTVIEKVDRPGITQSARWKLLCDCGNEREAYSKALRLGQIKSCGYCNGNGKHNLWKGVGDLSGSYFDQIKRNATTRKLSFDVSINDLWDLFLKQNRKCNLSGLDISLIKTTRKHEKFSRTASLDRIDSTKGYTIDNIQWVHKVVNQIKWNYDQSFFIDLCSKIAKYNEKYD